MASATGLRKYTDEALGKLTGDPQFTPQVEGTAGSGSDTPSINTSDFYQIAIDAPDFSSIVLPEVQTIDYASLMKELTPIAEASRDAAVTGALSLAMGQTATNATALQRALDTSIGQTKTAYASLSDAVLAKNMETLTAINPGWRDLLESSTGLAQKSADAVGAFMSANLPTMLAQGADVAKSLGKMASSLAKGELPEDIRASVERNANEKANANGLFGNAAGGAKKNLVGRDLGLTSLQMISYGAAMEKESLDIWSSTATSAAAMATAAQAPITAVADLQNKFGLLPNVDVNALFNETYSATVKATTVNPDTVFAGALDQYNQAMGWGVDIAKTNQEAQASYDSMKLQFETDKMGAEYANYAAKLAANTALWTAQLDARVTENAAQTNANAMLQAATIQAEASIEEASIGAEGAAKVAGINKGIWGRDVVGYEKVNGPGGSSYKTPVYDDVFKPAWT